MITEDYCSYEVAKLLKGKGFDDECRTVYKSNGCIHDNVRYEGKWLTNSLLFSSEYSAPTHQMAMKWLRQAHGIHIFSELGVREDKPEKYVNFWRPVIQGLYNTKHFRDINEKAKQHFAWKFYDNFEKSVDDALMFTLENLV